MCTAPGRAPWSYSSGSRTSSTSGAGGDALGGAGGVDLGDLGLGGRQQVAEAWPWLKAYRPGRDSGSSAGTGAAPSAGADQRRQELADRAVEHGVGEAVHLGRAAVDDDDPGARRPWPAARSWRPGTRCSVEPTASSRSHSSLTCIARSITSGTSAWPNEIVSLFRIPPHTRHGGSSSPARTRSSVSSIGRRSLAVPAPRPPHRAVHLDDQLGGGARPSGAARRRSG